MFLKTKKNELYYMKEILNMYSFYKRECSYSDKYLKNIKNGIMSINADKINSEYIKNVQTKISDLKFKDQGDYFVMKVLLEDWRKYKDALTSQK